jgi:hypothetical protein
MAEDSVFVLDRALADEFLLLAAEVVQGIDPGASHRLCSYLWSYY